MTADEPRALSRILVLVALGYAVPSYGFEPEHTHYLSVAVVDEDQGGPDLDGVQVEWVAWWDDHAPGLFLSAGSEYVEANDGGAITRITGSMSPVITGSGRVGFVLKPIIGLEYNNLDGSGFGGLIGAGAELGVRPSQRSQIALEYNWFKSFGGETSKQFAASFRWAFW